MNNNQLAKFAAIILVLFGVAALIAAALVSLQSFTAPGGPGPRQFDCGSVLFPKDPRNLAPRGANRVPLYLTRANRNCVEERSDRTQKALTFMLVGAAPLLFVLALPALSRRSRRSRSRRRKRM